MAARSREAEHELLCDLYGQLIRFQYYTEAMEKLVWEQDAAFTADFQQLKELDEEFTKLAEQINQLWTPGSHTAPNKRTVARKPKRPRRKEE